MTGLVLGGFRVVELAKATLRETMEDDVPRMAAAAAYYFLFSLFPLLLFLAPVLSFVGQKEQLIGGVLTQLSPVMPGDAMEVIESVLRDVVFVEAAPALMSVGALLAAFAASNVIAMLTGALNVAYDVTEPRAFWRRRLLALAFVVIGGLVIAAATTVLFAGERIISWLAGVLGVEELTARILTVVQYPLAFALLIAVLWLIYSILPATRTRHRYTLVGSVVAAVLWIVVTLGFRFYVTHLAGFNRTYGAIGGLIVLLMWMFLTMLVILIGGELNSELERGSGAVSGRRVRFEHGRIVTNQP